MASRTYGFQLPGDPEQQLFTTDVATSRTEDASAEALLSTPAAVVASRAGRKSRHVLAPSPSMILLSAMRYLGAVVAGMVGAAAGWFVAAALAAWIAGLSGMSDFEGERAMFAALFVGPIGGLVCMILAIWGALRIGKGRAPLRATLGRIGLVVGGIAAIVGAGIGLRLLTLDTYFNEAPPTLEFELRVPASMRLPDREAVRVELHTDKNIGDSYFSDPWLRTEGDHQVIAGGVPLSLKTSSRLLVVTLPDQPTRLFKLGLSRNPASTPAFGEWRGPDFVDAPGSDRPGAAPANDPVQLRHRVSR